MQEFEQEIAREGKQGVVVVLRGAARLTPKLLKLALKLAINAMKQVTEIDQGQQLNETPDVSSSSGEGYSELGKVYKDSNTGKLIMIEN